MQAKKEEDSDSADDENTGAGAGQMKSTLQYFRVSNRTRVNSDGHDQGVETTTISKY